MKLSTVGRNSALLFVLGFAACHLGSQEKIFACYPAIHRLLRPGGHFLNCDRFVDGVDGHLTALRTAGFGRVECIWQDPPRAIVVASRTDR